MISGIYPRCGVYYAKIQLDTWTKEQRVSLDTRDKRVALSKFSELLAEAERRPELTLQQLRRGSEGQGLAAVAEQWFAELKLYGLSPNTLKKMACHVRVLARVCRWTDVRDFTRERFIAWRKASPAKPKTLNDQLDVWHRFGRWLAAQGHLRTNPLEAVARIKITERRMPYRRPLTGTEPMRLLAVAPHPRVLVYRMALETALRRLELSRLRWSDITLEAGRTDVFLVGGSPPLGAGEGAWGNGPCVRVPASISKNRRTSVKPLGPLVVSGLLKIRPADVAPFQLVFAGMIPRCPTFYKDCRAAGIPLIDADGCRVDFHSLRSTHGDALIKNGESQYVVQESMRHSDIRLTQKLYQDARTFRAPIAQAVARLPWNADKRSDEGRATS